VTRFHRSRPNGGSFHRQLRPLQIWSPLPVRMEERIPPVTAELKPAFGIAEEAVLPVEQLVGEVRHGHEQQR
jgi:hypothetical protein